MGLGDCVSRMTPRFVTGRGEWWCNRGEKKVCDDGFRLGCVGFEMPVGDLGEQTDK